MLRWILLCAIGLCIIFQPMPVHATPQRAASDVLIYGTIDYAPERQPKKTWMRYDPATGTNMEIRTIALDSNQFVVSSQGKIAYVTGNSRQVYILNSFSESEQPYQIVSDNHRTYYPRAWSPDGRYLAFTSRNQSGSVQLYMWDGKNVIDLTPSFEYPEIRVEIAEVVWSADGRLAMTLRGEIFIWDRKRIVKLKQNRAGEDSDMVWSNDGQIAFISRDSDENSIYVWDGVSYKDGVPHPVTPIDSEEVYLMSVPIWTNTNKLAFSGWDKHDSSAQVYLWDGNKTINISRNPSLNNGTPRWAADGHWAYTTFFSSQKWLYVRSPDGATLLVTEGQYRPIWSADGKLAYCRQSQDGWQLRVWDGGKIITVAEADEIDAQWQSSGDVFCSSG